MSEQKRLEVFGKSIWDALGPGLHEQPGVSKAANLLIREHREARWACLGPAQDDWTDAAKAMLLALGFPPGFVPEPQAVGKMVEILQVIEHWFDFCNWEGNRNKARQALALLGSAPRNPLPRGRVLGVEPGGEVDGEK